MGLRVDRLRENLYASTEKQSSEAVVVQKQKIDPNHQHNNDGYDGWGWRCSICGIQVGIWKNEIYTLYEIQQLKLDDIKRKNYLKKIQKSRKRSNY